MEEGSQSGSLAMIWEVLINGKNHRLTLASNKGRWHCELDGRAIEIDAVPAGPHILSLLINGRAYEIKREYSAEHLYLWIGNTRYEASLRDPRSLRNRRDGARTEAGPRALVASMPGKVIRILVRENSKIEAGQAVLVVEAMKMQNEIESPKTGIVRKIQTTEGAAVNAGDVLAIVE